VVSAACLVGFLGLTVTGAHGVTQVRAACTLTRSLVVVDLDDVKHRTSSTTPSTLDARAKAHPPHPPRRGIREPSRLAAGHPDQGGL
jgi:hypothetical protein